jgi:DNA-binding transcriptional LysR family regulator
MTTPDFNLLVTLDVLLAEGSVAKAARRLRLSPSAMSRTLARLRVATGDPLLVRAGRGLVPTPRAIALRAQVGQLVHDGREMLHPAEALDFTRLVRTFTLRTSDGFVENFGPQLVARVGVEAPGVRLRFVQKQDRKGTLLRDGTIDLETGVVTTNLGPEIRAQGLFRDRLVGVVRRAHPLSRGKVTPARYASGRHASVSRHESNKGTVDDALAKRGLERNIVTIVGGFAAALSLARATDRIATVHGVVGVAPAYARRCRASLAARLCAGGMWRNIERRADPKAGAALVNWGGRSRTYNRRINSAMLCH